MPQKPPTCRPPFQPKRVSDHLRRGSAARRGYDSTWRWYREWYLSRNPICCFEDHPWHRHECEHAASVVDHITPLSQGGERLDDANVRSVCCVAHQRLTQNLKVTGKNELPPPKLAMGGWV